jgi:agmatinase
MDREHTNRLDMPFVGIPTFLRTEYCKDIARLDAEVAVMGVPFDEGVPFMPGSRFGPRVIREHSLRLTGRGQGFYDLQRKKQFLEHELVDGRIVDVGDADILPTNIKGTFDNVTAMVREILDRGAMPLVLGGDHAITYPVVRAYSEPIHVVHFDAHLDYAPFIHDLEYTNGHAFRHISPMPHVESLAQVGIRSLRNSREVVEDSLSDGNTIVTMQDFYENGPRSVAEALPKDSKTYVSIDVDVLDMSLVPGCVSAEPNGMTYAELRDTLIGLAEHTDVIGFDFVEVNPQLDVGTGVTSYLGAHLVVEFLGHICDQPRWLARRAG